MKNRIIQLIYHVVFLCVCFVGILDCFSFLFGDNFNLDGIVYYTTLSNILCFVVMLFVTYNNYKLIKSGNLYGKNESFLRVKYYSCMIITVTFIVYNFILVENIFSLGWNHIGNLTKHILVPILFVLDFFMFDARRRIKLNDIFISLSLPLFYAAVIIFRGTILPRDFEGTIFPYFFLNYREIGMVNVVKWIVSLAVFYFLLATLYYAVDKIKLKKD